MVENTSHRTDESVPTYNTEKNTFEVILGVNLDAQ